MIPVTTKRIIGACLRRAAAVLIRLSNRVDVPFEDIDEAPLPQNPITPEAAAMLAKPIASVPVNAVSGRLAGSVAARMAARKAF